MKTTNRLSAKRKDSKQSTSSSLDWLPDWKDESAYPSVETTSGEQWAWEFLRRNPEYQEDYRLSKSMSYDDYE